MRRKRKNSLEDYKINLIIAGIVLILMAVNIIMLIKYLTIDENAQMQNSNTTASSVNTNTVLDDVTDEEGKQMSEQDRMRRYAIEFIDNLDNEEFDVAYGKLSEDFKKTYFPTQNEFEQYVRENSTSKGIKLVRRYYGIIAKK